MIYSCSGLRHSTPLTKPCTDQKSIAYCNLSAVQEFRWGHTILMIGLSHRCSLVHVRRPRNTMVIEEFADRAQCTEACFLKHYCLQDSLSGSERPTLKDFKRSGALVSKSIVVVGMRCSWKDVAYIRSNSDCSATTTNTTHDSQKSDSHSTRGRRCFRC